MSGELLKSGFVSGRDEGDPVFWPFTRALILPPRDYRFGPVKKVAL